MVCRIETLTVDARNAYTQSEWWAQLLGFVPDPNDPNEPDHDECLITAPDGESRLLFINVPEPKALKNRLHLDLRPQERTRDDEVEWAYSIGATLVDDRRRPDGSGWVVLADPEGNEFCILRSDGEIGAH
jgi:hypothetical protein